MDRVINIKIVGNYISKDNKNAGVKGEANVTKLRISFDADWNKYSKKITFWNAKGLNPVVISLTTNLLADVVGDTSVYLVPIPTEPLSEAGLMTFVIDGFLNDKRQRSMSDTLVVSDAPIDDRATQPVELTPSQIDQFQAQLETILNDIHGAVEAKEDIQNMSVSSEELVTGEKAFVEKTEREGVVNLHFGLPAGNKGDKGDKGTSAVYIGKEAPTDPDITVWVYTYTDEEANKYGSLVNKSILKIKNRNGEWVNVATNVANDAIEKCEDATKKANEAANALNLSADEIRSGGFVEALKETNNGEKFTTWVGTKKQYDAIEKKERNRLYMITDDEGKAPRKLVEEIISGGPTLPLTDEEIDSALKTIYANMPDQSIRNVWVENTSVDSIFMGNQAAVTLYKTTSEWGCIKAFKYSSYGVPVELTRDIENGFWRDWCWVNPPMIDGVEYRTTKRVGGEIVYAKRVNCLNFPSKTSKFVSHGVVDENGNTLIRQIVSCTGYGNYAGLSIPYYDFHLSPTRLVCSVQATANSIIVLCDSSSWTAYNCWAIIEYLKK